MSDKSTSPEEQPSEGMKIRKRADSPEMSSPETPEAAPAAEPPTAQTSAEHEPLADDHEAASPPPRRRVVDPSKRPEPSRSTAQDEPLRSFEQSSTDDFAALFEQSGAEAMPTRRTYDKGEKVTAPVTHIDSRYVYVDLGGRGEARAPREQYLDEEGEVTLEIGQEYEFTVVGFGSGIELGSKLDGRANGLDAVEEAEATGLPLSGRVTGKNKGGFTVEVAGLEAFCPVSQIDLHNAEELDIYLGQTFLFKVMEVRDRGRSVVVSRAAHLREERDKAREETMKRVVPEAILEGEVRSISDFGAFVNLGGVDGLVHVSEMSWGNVDKPSDVVSKGQTVEVKVLKVEEGSGRNGPRIALSMKQVHEDPWNTVNERFHIGQRVKGTVVRTAPFGAFVELSPGIDGLVHVSELSWEHVRRTEDVVQAGDRVEVELLDIDLARQRIGLSMKNIASDPWDDAEQEYPVGQEVEGTVEKVEDFGAFIKLGQFTALLPRSEMELGRNETPHSKMRPGATVKARVLRVEPELRRMALTLKDEVDLSSSAAPPARASGGEQQGGASHRGAQSQRGYSDTGAGGSFGTLGDLLKRRQSES